MAVKIGDVTIRIGATTKQLEADLRKADRALQASSKRFTDAGQKMSLAFTAPFVALAGVSLVKFDAQIQAIGQVEAALKSTGGAAGKTSEELQKSASALQEITTFGDEDILKGVTSQLLTFTNVAGEQFDKAQLAALNLSTRLGTDLTSQTLQLGKALNDPVKGIGALSKAGIQFSKEQKETIKRFAETNQVAKAQDIILKELETQFGGSAEAAAKLGSGPIKQLNNQIGDLLEEFGKIISEALLPFVARVKNVVTAFQNMDGATKKTIVTVAALVATVGPLLFITGKLISVYAGIVGPIVKMIASLGAQAAASTAAAAANGVATTTTVAFGTALKATLLVAAPYIAVIGAIAAGIYLLYKNYQSADKAASTLNEVQKESAKSMAAEKAQGDRLIKVINDETKSKQDKKKALDELIAKNPEYFKGLTIEKDGIKKINEQYNNYIANLKAASFARAASSKQDQLAVQILELEDKKRQELSKLKRDEAAAAAESQRIQEGLSRQGVNFSQTAVDQTKQRISAIDLEIASLNSQSDALSKVIAKNKEIAAPAKINAEPLTPVIDDKLQRALQGINEELAKLDKLYNAGLIDATDLADQKISVLTKKLEILVTNGFAPTSKAVQDLKGEIEGLRSAPAIELLPQATGIQSIETVVSGLQQRITGGVTTATKAVNQILANTSTTVRDYYVGIGAGFVDAQGKFKNFAEEVSKTSIDVSSQLSQAFAGSLEAVGVMIGNLVSGEGAGSLKVFFNSILTVILDFAVGLGKQLIALGTATESLKKLFTNPIGAVIAGVGLIAVATIVKGIIAKGVPSLAVGTDLVKSDGLAVIHKGEQIIPADVVKGGYTGGGGIANVVGRIQGTDIILASDYSMNFKNRIR